MIHHMELRDIDAVVNIHMLSFPGFFLSFLGPRFLRLYYAGVCVAPEGIAYVLQDSSGDIAGFVVGSSNPRRFYSRLLRRDWVRFSFASLNAIFRHPSTIRRIARALQHPSSNPQGDEVAGLYSIAVKPECQGSGAGRELVGAFLEEAARRGCRKVFLTTDRDENEAVNAYYRKLGFSIERQYVTPEGRRMNEYWIEIRRSDEK